MSTPAEAVLVAPCGRQSVTCSAPINCVSCWPSKRGLPVEGDERVVAYWNSRGQTVTAPAKASPPQSPSVTDAGETYGAVTGGNGRSPQADS